MHLLIICVIVKYVKLGFHPKEIYPFIYVCYEYFCTITTFISTSHKING